MRPGEHGALIKLDTRAEFRAVYEGLTDPGDKHQVLRNNLFYGFNMTDLDRTNPKTGPAYYKPRLDEQRGFNVTVDNLEMVLGACETTLAQKGLRGAWLRINKAKSGAKAILSHFEDASVKT